jgi:hypothetical protein
MEARLVSLFLLVSCWLFAGAGYRTQNFIVTAPDRSFAKQTAEAAEKFRKELAKEWLGRELPPWSSPCPIQVVFKPDAEGRTSFSFQYGTAGTAEPVQWDMMVAGSRERILDAVLPHEVTHTIFATHFGRPLPRWADEGACTTVEHVSEKKKNHQMLLEFLTTERGIPFNQMFRMKEYPRDILPLYAQGYSLARFLIEHRGREHFIKYVGAGMESDRWDQVTKNYYGYKNLSDLQLKWLAWVKKGCPKIELDSDKGIVSANPNPSRSSSQEQRQDMDDAIDRIDGASLVNMSDQEFSDSDSVALVEPNRESSMNAAAPVATGSNERSDTPGGYYLALMRQGDSTNPAPTDLEITGDTRAQKPASEKRWR